MPPGAGRAWPRFFRSELRLTFGRRRNQVLLVVVALFPVLIGTGLRATAPPRIGGGLPFVGQFTGNGIYLSYLVLLTLVIPIAMAVVAGDAIAGEASYGTLRYLLAAPAGRTRLLTVKYAVIVVFALAVTFTVTGVALATGAALFPIGPVPLLSGTTVPLAGGILRLLYVTLYMAAAMASFGAIGLAISTLTEHAIGAIAGLFIIVIASKLADTVPQFTMIHPYLTTHWWNSFGALLRVPIDTSTLLRGLLSFGTYLLVAGSIAWARFTTADIRQLRAARRGRSGPRERSWRRSPCRCRSGRGIRRTVHAGTLPGQWRR